MKKLFTKIAIAVVGFTGVLTAQQDPQFTQWMHNKLIYNPGYAGTSGGVCAVAQFRQQWVSFAGAPQSIALAGDMRLGNALGVGLNIISDKIGPTNSLFIRAAGAWNKPLGNKGGVLGIGLDIGMIQKSINNNWITPEAGKIDNHIPGAYDALSNPALNATTYDLGFGAFYQIPGQFYVGLSSTHLPAQTLGSGDIKFGLSRHYYIMSGYSFILTPRDKLTPNIKIKSDLASTAIDANLTYMWDNSIWVGATYRLTDAAALLIGYQSKPSGANGLVWKIGYSYDYTLSKIKGYTSGTHEIIAGFCLTPKIKKISTYGDPRFLN